MFLPRTVTDLALPKVEVWRTYRGRADAENRIKELKADFGLDAFNMQKFWATEAALSFTMLAYNLMSMFRTRFLHGMQWCWLLAAHGKTVQFSQESLAIVCPEKEAGLVLRLVGQCIRSAMPQNLNKNNFLLENLGSRWVQ